jgi:hypothetical protein
MRAIKHASLLIVITTILGIANISAYTGNLDGKTFNGTTGILGKSSSEKDEIRFENGHFTSVGCEKYGFGPGSYITTVDGDRTHFTDDTYSEKTGRITWVGTISGGNIDATYLWYKKGKYVTPKQIKWFKGAMIE